jgi:hypothetical protein
VSGDAITLAVSGTYDGNFIVSQNTLTIEAGNLVTATLDGGGTGTTVTFNGSGTMSLMGITVTDGIAGGSNGDLDNAGGIFDQTGTLDIVNSTIANNQLGGIWDNLGSVDLTNSTLTGNSRFGVFVGCCDGSVETLNVTNSSITDNQGEGIYQDSGILNVSDSTISDNQAGGITNSGGDVTVADSTLSGNINGGGLSNEGTFDVSDSTFADNVGGAIVDLDGSGSVTDSTLVGNTSTGDGYSYGAGITSLAGTVTTAGSIIANNSGADCFTKTSSPGGAVADDGYNIDDDGSCGLTASTSDSDSRAIDAYLGSLGENGGPTETVPLLASSSVMPSPGPDPALGVIPSSFVLPTGGAACSVPDQRGVPRSAPCDIGAFELPIDTVAFNSDGGAAVSSLSGPDGSSITLPSDSYPDNSFDGWFTAASSGTEVGGAGSSYTIPSGGITLYAQWTAIPPTISGFSPTSGPPGTKVTIRGTDLEGAISVKIHGVVAKIKSDAANQIVIKVPSEALTGPIKVKTPSGKTNSATDFKVT